MEDEQGLAAAAELFKALGSVSRLGLLRQLSSAPRTVTALVAVTGMSQPLISQHLRTLRGLGIVAVERSGREALYRLADHHIAHVIDDTIAHVLEETDPVKEEQP